MALSREEVEAIGRAAGRHSYDVFLCQTKAEERIIVLEGQDPEPAFAEALIDEAKYYAHDACQRVAGGFASYEEAEKSDAYLESPEEAANPHIKEVTTYSGTHVTSDPAPVYKSLRSGTPLTETRAEGLVGDLGTSGLYFSDAPQLWMGRARGKWEFLYTLSPGKKQELGKAVLEELERKAPGYLAQHEMDVARRDIGYFMSGDLGPEVIVSFAGQPYNVAFWKEEFLDKLGIKQRFTPIEIPVRVEGRFADVTRYVGDKSELAAQLRREGFDGMIHRGGMAELPQAVVWNNKAVKQFGEWKEG